jgi:hypothetical protein
MHPFIVAVIINWIAAFFDGFTTQMAIKTGAVEGNLVLDKIYGTNKPTALQEYGIGFGLEAAEVALYLVGHKFLAVPFWVFIVLLLAEAGVHVACAVSNYQLAKTGKALFTL